MIRHKIWMHGSCRMCFRKSFPQFFFVGCAEQSRWKQETTLCSLLRLSNISVPGGRHNEAIIAEIILQGNSVLVMSESVCVSVCVSVMNVFPLFGIHAFTWEQLCRRFSQSEGRKVRGDAKWVKRKDKQLKAAFLFSCARLTTHFGMAANATVCVQRDFCFGRTRRANGFGADA